jgi:hypothetical protein
MFFQNWGGHLSAAFISTILPKLEGGMYIALHIKVIRHILKSVPESGFQLP